MATTIKCRNTGRTHFKEGCTPWNKGKKLSPEHRAKLSEAKKDYIPWNKGIRQDNFTNEQNPQWKGDKVSYRSLHRWVERHNGKPDRCEHCSKSGLSGHDIHWANISKEYKRELSDWLRLCAGCHGAFDKKGSV